MRISLFELSTLVRPFHSFSRLELQSLNTATPAPRGCPDIQAFQKNALISRQPLYFHRDVGSPSTHLPALKKWFAQDPSPNPGAASPHPFVPSLLHAFQECAFPYELVTSLEERDVVALFCESLTTSVERIDQVMAGILQSALTQGQGTDQTFYHVFAPFRLLVKAIEYNSNLDRAASKPLRLYIAQSPLTDLPKPQQDDLPAPELVRQAGKGDIYSSSIWLGTEPTYTPLHRDPNPNLFCQLFSKKAVRLLPPHVGDRLFYQVQTQLQRRRNSRFRSAEMMQGPERQLLHDVVWERPSVSEDMYQVELDAGDALFIPDGWWHSVKSVKSDGHLNSSVNWWFR